MVMLEARPEPISLDPAKTALIVVDMQNAFLSSGGLLDKAGIDISQAPHTIEAAQRVLKLVRGLGMPVIHLQVGYPPDLSIRDAYFLEYWPILIADAAMQAGPAFIQDATIFNVEHFFGWVTTSEALEKALQRVPQDPAS